MWKLVVCLMCVGSVNCLFNLTILHTNDVHARYEQTNQFSAACTKDFDKCVGGYARLIWKVKDMKQKYPTNLVLDAGDQYQGTTWFYHFGGNVTSYFMNLLGYDAMTIGNHEFDNKISGLVPFLEKVKFPVVSSNIDASKEPTMSGKFNKSTILTVDGQKIAVIGYTTTDTPSISSTGKLIFNNEVESVRAEVAVIKQADPTINKFIALGHAGFTTDKLIAEQVEEIDIVVGGHSNTFLYSGTPPSIEKPEGEYPFIVNKANGKKALCVQDYAYGKYLGFLNVIFDDEGVPLSWSGNPILLDKTVPKDANTVTEMEPWKKDVDHFKKTPVGETRVFLEGDSKKCRTEECNLGNVLTDSILRYNVKNRANAGINWNNISIVLMNSGGIRSPVEQGKITFEDVLSVLPFRNTVSQLDLKGSDLIEVLEHGVGRIVPGKTEDLAGRFLQVSGLRIKYNVNKSPGSRVVDVKVMCTECTIPVFEDLNKDKYYTVILPNFVADGGDDFAMIPKLRVNYLDSGDLDSTVLNDYLRQFSPIVTGLDGRIQFVNDDTEGNTCETNSANNILTSTSFIIFSFISVVLSIMY